MNNSHFFNSTVIIDVIQLSCNWKQKVFSKNESKDNKGKTFHSANKLLTRTHAFNQSHDATRTRTFNQSHGATRTRAFNQSHDTTRTRTFNQSHDWKNSL